jgi:hypothetical protein
MKSFYLYLFSYRLLEQIKILVVRSSPAELSSTPFEMHTISPCFFTGAQVFWGKKDRKASRISHNQYISSMYAVVAEPGYGWKCPLIREPGDILAGHGRPNFAEG